MEQRVTYAMTTNYRPRRPHCDTVDGLDASRRVGWAMFYEELDQRQRLQVVNAMLRTRADDLVELLMELVDSVLHDRNLDAFAVAYKVQEAVERFLRETGR